MMHKFFLLFASLSVSISMLAQDYPSTWTMFTMEGYIHSIEKDMNGAGISQSVFLNRLLDRARVNVAKQLGILVSDNATLVKQSVNGVTNIEYSDLTTFSTEASMRLLHTDTYYCKSDGSGYAIAYLDKKELCEYWSKEAGIILSEQESEFSKAKRLISSGYKERAKVILEGIPSGYGKIAEPLGWLRLCSCSEEQYKNIVERFADNVRQVDEAIVALGHGIAIFLDYHSDLFGEEYLAAVNQLSAKLSSVDRSFVDDPTDADWIVQIVAKAREGQTSTIGNHTAFFAYIDVSLKIVKGSIAQVVFADSFSIKEGDTRGMRQAALAAFQKIESPLFEKINPNIKD